ncbi:MAG: hypothetical protein JWR77_829 [Rhizorhabdus sp.]|nr:hypothetical protein [Rhizorhabdus sp.]
MLVAVVMIGTIAWMTATAPPWRLRDASAQGVPLLAADGTPITRIGGTTGDPVDAAALPIHVRQAFIAIEDRRFYVHYGVDLRGIARATWRNARAGHVVEGGSTITQQYAKFGFLNNDRTFGRKLRESLLAMWIEMWLGKDDILSRYLSSTYFGDGAYGLTAAAHHYFNKKPQDLTVDQAAMLAGLVKAPSRLAPTRDPAAARARARLVLAAMVDAGFITAAEAASPHFNLRPGRDDIPEAGYFADWVTSALPENHRGTIQTTLDPELQRHAVAAVAGAGRGNQVALVAMRPDGRVVAMVGGRDYRASSFNRATRAQRQPGSTFKLFVYLAALRNGADPDMLVDDLPLTIGTWQPANADGRYRGPISLRDAFALSSNVAAVRIAETTGRDKVIAMARDLGVASPLPDTPSLALGSGTMTLMELTSAYAAVARGASPVTPHGAYLRAAATRPLDRDREWKPMLDMLWQAANAGTGRTAALSQPTFGKTGTTQDNRDAWFVGFAGDLVVGIWVGRDDNKPVPGLSGGKLPATIWHRFMSGIPLGNAPQEYAVAASAGISPLLQAELNPPVQDEEDEDMFEPRHRRGLLGSILDLFGRDD